MKLSKAQRDVLQKLVDGWTVCMDFDFTYRAIRFKPECQESRVHPNTICALMNRDLILPDKGFPKFTYRITEAGKMALESN